VFCVLVFPSTDNQPSNKLRQALADVIKVKLKHVAIAMHCNLRSPDAGPVIIRFNFVSPTPSLKSLSQSTAVL